MKTIKIIFPVVLMVFIGLAISFSTGTFVPEGLIGAALFAGIVKGSLSGKLGQLVFGSWKGKQTVRTKPDTYNESTDQGHVDAKSKFGLIQNFARNVLSIIAVGYQNYAIGMSEYNYCISQNNPSAITGTTPNFTKNYPLLKMSQGILVNPTDCAIDKLEYDGISITWTDNSGDGNALATDKATMVIIGEASDIATKVKSVIVDALRSIESCSVILPSTWTGETIYAYIFFTSADGQLVSDTIYAGTGTVTAP